MLSVKKRIGYKDIIASRKTEGASLPLCTNAETNVGVGVKQGGMPHWLPVAGTGWHFNLAMYRTEDKQGETLP